MEGLLFTLVVLSVAGSGLASVAIGPAQIELSQPNMCFEPEKSAYYSPGASWQLEGCGMATCRLTNYTGTPQLMVSYESCGSVSADPPCVLTEDSAQAYPDCCPQVVCPEDTDQDTSAQGERKEEDSDAYNEIEDNNDVYSEAKEAKEADYATGNTAYAFSVRKDDGDEETESSEAESSRAKEAENLIGEDEDAYFGFSPEDLQFLDRPEQKGRKASPRFSYLEAGSPYAWF